LADRGKKKGRRKPGTHHNPQRPWKAKGKKRSKKRAKKGCQGKIEKRKEDKTKIQGTRGGHRKPGNVPKKWGLGSCGRIEAVQKQEGTKRIDVETSKR